MLKRKRNIMTSSETLAFDKVLRNKQAELETGNRDRSTLTIETSPDDLDQLQHATDRDLAMGNLERNSAQLRDVRMALLRIKADTFGQCVECGQAVTPKRLAAVPWAASCIVCQAASDAPLSLAA
jgi:DnaK suppressor protein